MPAHVGWVLSIKFLIIFYFNVCLCALYLIPTQYVYSLLHIFLSNVSELCLFNIAPILKWCKYTYKWSSLISFQKLFSHSFVRVFRERERERERHTHTHFCLLYMKIVVLLLRVVDHCILRGKRLKDSKHY